MVPVHETGTRVFGAGTADAGFGGRVSLLPDVQAILDCFGRLRFDVSLVQECWQWMAEIILDAGEIDLRAHILGGANSVGVSHGGDPDLKDSKVLEDAWRF